MKTATVLTNKFSKKQLSYMVIGIISVLTVIGVILGFFTLQRVSRASEEAPQNIVVAPIGTKAKVSWETASETIAVVEYGTQPDPTSFSKFAFSETPTTAHAVDMSSLQPNTTYYFQIRSGDMVFDNGGQLWSFTTEAAEPEPTGVAIPDPSVSTPVLQIPSVGPTPELSATPSGELTPTGVMITPVATIDPNEPISPTSMSVTSAISSPVTSITATTGTATCNFTNCTTIQQNLGGACRTQDYIKCLFGVTSAPAAATSPTATPVPASVKASCAIDYFQPNTCTSLTWTSLTDSTVPACAATYKKYFIQCKSNSFESTDAATWYCNKTSTTNEITLPCGNAPTPPAGQSVFCRVRGETESGGATDATPWVYTSTSCANYTSALVERCAIKYLQSGTCVDWTWDFINSKDSECKKAFSSYFFQCASNNNFEYSGISPTPLWYCNTTSTDHNLSLACGSAQKPANGTIIYCRVRAEDSVGGTSHSTAWTDGSATCPTSTPTPTFTVTPTPTRTPTPVP